ncbi:TPA: phage tail protein, partial [Salmonella enterica]
TALINGAPATLDTLKEIAAAINNDPKFSTTINNVLSGKQPLDETLTHLSGKDVAGLLAYLGLGETINLARNAVPATRRINSKPLTGDITLWASDVGALPIAGGRLNGALGIGADNALGGNSIVLGDNDTGIKQNGDGVLDIYANSAHVLRFISILVESMVSLKVNGNAVATGEVQAGNGSSRMTNNGDIFGSVWGNSWLSLWINNNFVADVQLGAGTSVTTWNNAGSWPNTPGYVVTSVWKDNQGENIDGINYAPLQKRVGNQWYTVQGGTT